MRKLITNKRFGIFLVALTLIIWTATACTIQPASAQLDDTWPMPVPAGSNASRIFTHLAVTSSEQGEAGNYYTTFRASKLPTNAIGHDYTSASFQLQIGDPCDMDNLSLSQTCGFTQLGLLTTGDSVRWFAFSFLPIECVRGTPAWIQADGSPMGCIGDAGDLVGLGSFHEVHFIKDWDIGDHWVLYVDDVDTLTFPVAKVKTEEITVTSAASTFGVSSNNSDGAPDLEGYFWHGLPHYRSGDDFPSWPSSTLDDPEGNRNIAQAVVNGACPEHYGIMDYIESANRSTGMWYTGTYQFGDREKFVCRVDPLF